MEKIKMTFKERCIKHEDDLMKKTFELKKT